MGFLNWLGIKVELEVGEEVEIIDPGKGHPKNVRGRVSQVLPFKWGEDGEPPIHQAYVVECNDGVDRKLEGQRYDRLRTGTRVDRGRACPPAPIVNRNRG